MESQGATQTRALAPNVADDRPTILMLVYHFAPDNSSGTHRSLHFARALVDAGFDVRVVTAALEDLEKTDEALDALFPHPELITRVRCSATLGDHYLRLKSAGGDAAPAIDPLATGASTNGAARRGRGRASPLGWVRRQIAAWDDFPDAKRGWKRNAVRAGVSVGAASNADVVYVSGPPWTGVIAAEQVARRLRKPLVVDYRDPFTRYTGRFNEYPERWCRSWAAALEARVFRHARLALFATPGVRGKAEQSYGDRSNASFRTILNGSDVPLNPEPESFDRNGTLLFRHFGTLYRGRSLLPLLRALIGAVGDGAPSICVQQIGAEPISPRELEGLALPACVRVEHVPEIPFGEAVRKMAEPAVLVISQPGTFRYQIPTKLFDYLCTGNPTLVIAPEESDTWAVARDFPRCLRIDHEEGGERSAAILRELIERWRSGALRRERTVEDTAGLTKEALAAELVSVMRELIDAGRG